MKINRDSSIIFIYATDENEIFVEHKGTIKKINDSIYHISPVMTFGKFDNMRLYLHDTITNITNDTDYFSIAKTFVKATVIITIRYANRQMKKFAPYEKQGKQVAFALDKRLFNKKPGSNFYTIITKRKNAITEQLLTFKVRFGSSPSFILDEKEEFDVIIKNDKLWTSGKPPLQTVYFKLKKNSGS